MICAPDDLTALVDYVWPKLGLYTITADSIDFVHSGKFVVAADLAKLKLYLHLHGVDPSSIDHRLHEMDQSRLSVNDAPFLAHDEFLLRAKNFELGYYLLRHDGQHISLGSEAEIAKALVYQIKKRSSKLKASE